MKSDKHLIQNFLGSLIVVVLLLISVLGFVFLILMAAKIGMADEPLKMLRENIKPILIVGIPTIISGSVLLAGVVEVEGW